MLRRLKLAVGVRLAAASFCHSLLTRMMTSSAFPYAWPTSPRAWQQDCTSIWGSADVAWVSCADMADKHETSCENDVDDLDDTPHFVETHSCSNVFWAIRCHSWETLSRIEVGSEVLARLSLIHI